MAGSSEMYAAEVSGRSTHSLRSSMIYSPIRLSWMDRRLSFTSCSLLWDESSPEMTRSDVSPQKVIFMFWKVCSLWKRVLRLESN